MKLPNRSFTARSAAAVLLAAGASFALAPAAGAATTETTPVDDAVAVVAQYIYPDAMPEDFTAQERLEGWLGMNNYPGGPFGAWGPEGGSGYYGQIVAVTGPLPVLTDAATTGEDPFDEVLGGVTSLVFGSEEDHSETAEAELYPVDDESEDVESPVEMQGPSGPKA